MKRTRTLIPLSQDHHHGLLLAALIKKDAPPYKTLPQTTEGKLEYTLKAWENELSIHFKNEEEILFPVVKGKDEEIDGLINGILEEHKEIEKLIVLLKTSENKIDTLDNLGNLLERHIRKEERILFQKIQEIFTEKELENLVGKISRVKK